MTGPDVWTQASIDFFCPDPESPDYLAALFRRAHYYGNTKGMGAVDLATELGHTGGNRESIPEMATPADTQKQGIYPSGGIRYRRCSDACHVRIANPPQPLPLLQLWR